MDDPLSGSKQTSGEMILQGCYSKSFSSKVDTHLQKKKRKKYFIKKLLFIAFFGLNFYF